MNTPSGSGGSILVHYFIKPDTMKLQDMFPYDRSQFEYDNKFSPIGSDTFLINSNCVWIRKSILVVGNTYFLFTFDEEKNTTGTAVDIVDCFYHHDMFYLLVEDVFTNEVRLLNHTLDNGLTMCSWRLVDGYTIDKMIEGKYFI